MLHVCRRCLKELASLRLQFRANLRSRDTAAVLQKQVQPRKKQTKTAAAAGAGAAQAIATHGLLTRQLPPQFVHNAIGPNSHGWPRPGDAGMMHLNHRVQIAAARH